MCVSTMSLQFCTVTATVERGRDNINEGANTKIVLKMSEFLEMTASSKSSRPYVEHSHPNIYRILYMYAIELTEE